MFLRFLRFALAIPIAIALAQLAPTAARANQTGGATYCMPPFVFQDGTVWQATPLNTSLAHAEQCGGQYGDLFADGPLQNPALGGVSPSSLQFTIPAEVWIAIGQRISTAATLETAPASQVSYWWLSTATNQYTFTLSSSPPDAYSVLEYTITANGTGILSDTTPAYAAETLNGSFALASLAPGCLQITTGGVFTSTGLTCGSGSPGIANVSAGSNMAVNIVSGNATIGVMSSPTFTGTPAVASASQAGILQFGSDTTAALARTGTNTFTFTATAGSGVANVVASGGFSSASSSYGPTSAFVNGALIAGTLAGSGLVPGQCVQTTTGGVLTTTGGACGPTTALSQVVGGPNIGVSLLTSTATIGLVISPAVGGSLTAGSTTAFIPTVSDLSASDSTSSGGLDLGGTVSHCRMDYGDTTAGTITFGCPVILSTAAITSLQVSGGIAADNATVPAHGFACGASAVACDFTSGTGSSGTTAFFFNNPICSGSNNDIMQYANASVLAAYIGCDGSYNVQDSGTPIVNIGNQGILLNSPTVPLPIVTTNGPLVASYSGTTMSPVITGAIYSATSDNTGSINFGVFGSGPDEQCGLSFVISIITSGCNFGVSGTSEASTGFIVGTSTLTPCGLCVGTTGTTTANIMAYGAGAALGSNTLSTSNTGLTFGSTTIPCNGLAITNTGSGLIDCWDAAGSYGIIGDLRTGHSVGSQRSIIGGWNTAVAPTTGNYGDVEGSRSASTGNLDLGGTTTSGNLDFGITTPGVFTFDHAVVTNTHITCSATSGWPCSFTWSATLSSGAGTATQAVPTSSFCTVTPTITLKISSTNVDVYWVTISSTTLTVHVSDMLGTDSRSITGNGSCSP